MTAGDRYSICKSENLPQPIQIQLSGKQKTFSRFFAQSVKSTSYFENFENKDHSHNWCISEKFA